MSTERRSKVTFDIEPVGEIVKLAVIHDDFDPDSTVIEMIGEGWPHLLSNLKLSASQRRRGDPDG